MRDILVLQNVAHDTDCPMSEMRLQEFSHQLETHHSHFYTVLMTNQVIDELITTLTVSFDLPKFCYFNK